MNRIYGRPVMRHSGVDRRLRLEPCPKSVDELRVRLARDSLRLFDGGAYGFLIAERFLRPWSEGESPFQPRMKWKAVRIEVQVYPTDLPERVRAVAGEIVAQTRPIPLHASEDPAGGTTTVALAVRFSEEQEWSDTAPVVALLDQEEIATGRVAYGRIRAGRFQLLWDSPLVRSSRGFSLLDVTGDGASEILIESSAGGNHIYPVLAVFDTAGRELTRQEHACDVLLEAFDASDGVCAIKGADMVWEAGEEGAGSELWVTSWSGDGEDRRFRLRDGVFRPVADSAAE